MKAFARFLASGVSVLAVGAGILGAQYARATQRERDADRLLATIDQNHKMRATVRANLVSMETPYLADFLKGTDELAADELAAFAEDCSEYEPAEMVPYVAEWRRDYLAANGLLTE